MPTHSNNRIVVDLKKVAYARFFYRNQWGDIMALKPLLDTVYGQAIHASKCAYPLDDRYPFETMLERAKRINSLDVWKPVLHLRLSAADVLEFRGDKAISLWKAWNEMQFNRKKK